MNYRLIIIFFVICIDLYCITVIPQLAKSLLKTNNILVLSVLCYAGLRYFERMIRYILDIIFFPIINQTIIGITKTVCQHTQNVPLNQSYDPGEIMKIMGRISSSSRFLLRNIFTLVLPSLLKIGTIVATLFYMNILNWQLLCILLSFGVGCLLYMQIYFGTRSKAWAQSDQSGRIINNFLRERILHKQYPTLFDQYVKPQLQLETKAWYKENIALNISHCVEELFIFIITFVILYSGLTVFQSQAPEFLKVQALLQGLTFPVRSLLTEYRQIGIAFYDIKKVLNFLQQTQPKNKGAKASITPIQPNVLFSCKSLTTGYNEPLLKDVNLSINRGDRILVTGQNGSGKSTLMKTLCGILDPIEGECVKYTDNILYIDEDCGFLNETVRFHLLLGQTNPVDDKKLEDALKKVGLHKKNLNRSMNGLSLGERNRVWIARLFIQSYEVLILDEALHSIPVRYRSELLKSLPVETIIIIMHDSILMDWPTAIWEVEDGKITPITADICTLETDTEESEQVS